MRKDTYAGMGIANIVFLSIVITAATVLGAHGITEAASASTAAAALKPLAEDLASVLFTVGIFGVGLLAVPVMAGTSAYALLEVFGWKEGLGAPSRASGAEGGLPCASGFLVRFAEQVSRVYVERFR